MSDGNNEERPTPRGSLLPFIPQKLAHLINYERRGEYCSITKSSSNIVKVYINNCCRSRC